MHNEFERGACLPFVQSLISGFFVGLIMAGIAIWIIWSSWLGLALSVGSTFSLWWFSTSIQMWRQDVYQPYPTVYPTESQQITHTERIEVIEGNTVTIAELDLTPDEIKKMSTALLSGVSFSEDAMKSIPLTRSQFQKVRAEFISRGWAQWINADFKNLGCRLSPAGRAVCRQYARK